MLLIVPVHVFTTACNFKRIVIQMNALSTRIAVAPLSRRRAESGHQPRHRRHGASLLATDAEQPAEAGVCDKCGSTEFKRRPDDNEETVRKRMQEYRGKTAPILPGYEERGIVSRVDGMASIEDVTSAIDAVLTR